MVVVTLMVAGLRRMPTQHDAVNVVSHAEKKILRGYELRNGAWPSLAFGVSHDRKIRRQAIITSILWQCYHYYGYTRVITMISSINAITSLLRHICDNGKTFGIGWHYGWRLER